MHRRKVMVAVGVLAGTAACVHVAVRTGGSESAVHAAVRPGITVLVNDSLALISGKRVALLTNQTGVDASGVSDIELLRTERTRQAGVKLIKLFSPEHGIRGTEDHEQVASGVDERSGLPVHSLYGNGTIGPPDSLLKDVDVIVYDLQDIGTRTWTYVGAMIYTMRAAAKHRLPLIVLDRPNPITGDHVDPPLLDTAFSNPEDPTPQRPGKAYALYPFPLRHGMTMGEMARFYNETLRIGAPLHVMPADGWRRSMWQDETGLAYIRPSPNLPTLTTALTYPSLVPFEGSNVSVGRGTSDAFQRFGAPWMNAELVAQRLNARGLPGVRFVVDPFTPVNAGDNKYNNQRIPGIRIDITDRNAVRSGRTSAAIYWALLTTHRDSFTIRPLTFDERFGSRSVREAIAAGTDPDVALRAQEPAVAAFLANAKRFFMYR